MLATFGLSLAFLVVSASGAYAQGSRRSTRPEVAGVRTTRVEATRPAGEHSEHREDTSARTLRPRPTHRDVEATTTTLRQEAAASVRSAPAVSTPRTRAPSPAASVTPTTATRAIATKAITAPAIATKAITAPPIPTKAITAPPIPTKAITAPTIPTRIITAPTIPTRIITAPTIPTRIITAPTIPTRIITAPTIAIPVTPTTSTPSAPRGQGPTRPATTLPALGGPGPAPSAGISLASLAPFRLRSPATLTRTSATVPAHQRAMVVAAAAVAPGATVVPAALPPQVVAVPVIEPGVPTVAVAGPLGGVSLASASHLGIPIVFVLLVGVSLLMQGFVGRRDPKLAEAPARSDTDTVPFT